MDFWRMDYWRWLYFRAHRSTKERVALTIMLASWVAAFVILIVGC